MKAPLIRYLPLALLFCFAVPHALIVRAEHIPPPPDLENTMLYQSRIPLGWESFLLKPEKTCLYLMGSVENPKFNGWRKIFVAHRSRLVDVNGAPVRVYPDHLQFRITASTREKLSDNDPFPFVTQVPLNEFLLGLHFRLKVFHGIDQRTIHPVSVEPIGMPADVAYDERIYRVSFSIGQIPIGDRVVLEVLSPNGQRISKFHVDLF